LLAETQKDSASSLVYKTGWQFINKMTNGGLRPGELTVVSALQHKYKSGFARSLFLSTMLFNQAKPKKKGLKPLMVFISFEDPLAKIIKFMYELLYFNEFKKVPDFENLSSADMEEYMSTKFAEMGWEYEMLRVDPTFWNYKSVQEYIEKLEAQGYDVKGLFVDYLAKLPTIGCRNTGGTGSDLKDMFTRLKNYFEKKEMLFMTPHQMSPDALELVRQGVTELDLVHKVAERGYYSGSKQLAQDIDLEFFLHIAYVDGRYYLTVKRGKHKDNIVDEKDKYGLLPFPVEKMPIPFDVDNEKPIHMQTPEKNNFTEDLEALL